MTTQHRSQIDPFTERLLSYVETGYRVALALTGDPHAAVELARDAMTSLWLRRVELERLPATIKTELLSTIREFHLNKHRAGIFPARLGLDASGERPAFSGAREHHESAPRGLARLAAR